MAGGAGARLVWPVPFSVDAAGIPRPGAQLWTYATGTNTPLTTYNDAALTVANPNPIVADEAGQFGSVFMLPASYKLVLEDAAGGEIWTADPCGFATTVTNGILPGMQMVWPGSSLPPGYLWCDGSAVSRTVYAALFAEISTNYGGGDGVSTFNVPDRRGRVSVGRDDMGGVPAGRITVGGCGINGAQLGAAGGDELAQQHDHSNTPATHNHPVTDPKHHHGPPNEHTGGPNVGFLYWNQVTPTYGHFLPGAFVPAGISPGDTSDEATGITVGDGTATTTVNDTFLGHSQNVQPCLIDNWIIFAGA